MREAVVDEEVAICRTMLNNIRVNALTFQTVVLGRSCWQILEIIDCELAQFGLKYAFEVNAEMKLPLYG
jgi:hypothetical protein